jgi:hypothetical protein
MLATAVRQLPVGADEYAAEVKWDGMRAVAAVSDGRVRIWSRTGRDVTAAYPELGALAGFQAGGGLGADRLGLRLGGLGAGGGQLAGQELAGADPGSDNGRPDHLAVGAVHLAASPDAGSSKRSPFVAIVLAVDATKGDPLHRGQQGHSARTPASET